mmetsp:Transcript_20894/g.72075  ORF Transcript_20894/g.72075 Transcript_20894/m.72075 type:complete len:269 (+) Transcript_20894:1579-2385(+)
MPLAHPAARQFSLSSAASRRPLGLSSSGSLKTELPTTAARLAPISTEGPSGPKELPPARVIAAPRARTGAMVGSFGGRPSSSRSAGTPVPPTRPPAGSLSQSSNPMATPEIAGPRAGRGPGRASKPPRPMWTKSLSSTTQPPVRSPIADAASKGDASSITRAAPPRISNQDGRAFPAHLPNVLEPLSHNQECGRQRRPTRPAPGTATVLRSNRSSPMYPMQPRPIAKQGSSSGRALADLAVPSRGTAAEEPTTSTPAQRLDEGNFLLR